ncbi:MAG: hypothetical protein J6K29_04680 [Clostridia bacterium]|nr:hypothetical protein [Clostridia bacterium]
MKNTSKTLRIILAVVIGTVLTALTYYFMLPPINVFSTGFWTYLIMIIFFYGLPLGVVSGLSGVSRGTSKIKLNKVFLVIAAIPVAVLVLGGIFSSTFFNALKYASVIEVHESDFSEDMPEADVVTNISLMDTASASILGNRELGALSDVVSQYNVSLDYNQINYKGTPKKVANLEYVDFFRWLNNSANGVPGYVMVDPVGNDADYVKFAKPMIYVDSAYFEEDLMRKLRFSYPTKIFSSVNFEIDEEGNPFYIVSCMKPHVGLFGAMDVNEVIIFNPCDGTSQLYAVADAPSWIDNVYDGDLACGKYDWYGTLSGGFWNSIIGNRDCKQTTQGYGYVVRGDDVWYYTGVTSVAADESNIGFILTNARTGEYKYYPVIGAEEYSAMGAAQGEVQETEYVASFPSLINVESEPTYIMVLKDAQGLVKLYALVNVQNYGIVATGTTQQEAKEAYLEELYKRGVITEEELPAPETKTADVLVQTVRLATVGGETVVYITAEDGTVYRGSLAADESLILITEGMSLTVTYAETEHARIRAISEWSEKAE